MPDVKGEDDEETLILNVDAFVNEQHQWGDVGTEPWIDTEDEDSSYVWADDLYASRYWSFEDMPPSLNIIDVDIFVRGKAYSGMTSKLRGWLWDGVSYEQFTTDNIDFIWYTNSYWTQSEDVDATGQDILNTEEQINGARLRIYQYQDPYFSPNLRITLAYIRVVYLPAPSTWLSMLFGLGLFIGGIIMMIASPSWVAWGIRKEGVTPDTVERAGYGMLIFILGLGLFLTYLYA